MNNFERMLSLIPAPADLHTEAKQVAQDNSDYSSFVTDALEGFDVYKSDDGAGQEGNIAFYKQNGEVIAALLYAYDHESALAAPLEGEAAESQFVFNGILDVFTPVLNAGSPFLWNYEEYPSTQNTVFATAATWNTGDRWEYSPDIHTSGDFLTGEPVDVNELASHIKYSFKRFAFVQEYKNNVS